MKILMTTDTVGGVWTYSLELARALQRDNVQIALATMGAPITPQQRAQAAELWNVTLFDSAYKLEWMADPWDDVKQAGRWLLEIEQKFQPDLVHLNGYAHGALPFRAPVVVVAHSCVLSWWRAVKGEDAPAAWNRYRNEVASGLDRADMVIAPSTAMLEALVSIYGLLSTTRVIYNGRDAGLYRIGPKESLVLSAGRIWDEAKNIVALDHVAGDVTWPIALAGQDKSPDGQAAGHKHVKPLGMLNPRSMANWMAKASIYALPARYEPFGLSILEAALCGCALVLGDIKSLREVWADAAVYVPPNDDRAIAEALQELIDDGTRRTQMAQKARQRAMHYSPQRMAQAYMIAYQSTLTRAGHGLEESLPVSRPEAPVAYTA